MNDIMNIGLIYESINQNFLYHATYKPLIKNIKKFGLGGNPKKRKNWEDSKDVVYLANDPDVAESYAEESELVNEDWLDEIVIFKIDTNNLDINLLKNDKNVRNDDQDTFEYYGIIPYDFLLRIE
jgi:hypothetical protein